MIIYVYITPAGGEYTELPKRYGATSPVTEAWALSHGWRKEEREVPDEVKRYSKLKLYDALENAGIWGEVKAAIESAGQWERYNQCDDLATDYPLFSQMVSAMREKYGNDTVDAILASAEE